jgi:HSP20 family protein
MYVTTRSLTRLPATDVATLGGRINRMLNDMFNGTTWSAPEGPAAAWVPAVDVVEEKDAIRILAELPGVNPADVKISLDDNVLTIHGTKQQTAEQQTDRVHRYERTYGAFERTFTLPATVEAANITAQYENGVLTVTLPKVEQAKPRQIQIEVARR